MISEICSGNATIIRYESNGLALGMEKKSLDEHILKHSEIASDAETYLKTAAEVIENGRNYKNGKLYKGIFVSAAYSQEFGMPIVFTAHKRFH